MNFAGLALDETFYVVKAIPNAYYLSLYSCQRIQASRQRNGQILQRLDKIQSYTARGSNDPFWGLDQ